MKIFSIVIKSFKEQLRSFWVLLLTLAMGPFFIMVYYLITESYKANYTVLIVNEDSMGSTETGNKDIGKNLIDFVTGYQNDTLELPVTFMEMKDRNAAIRKVKQKKADALIILHKGFSADFIKRMTSDSNIRPVVEFTGDLTSSKYLVSAVWMNELLDEFVLKTTDSQRVLNVIEEPLGVSGTTDEFSLMVPGLLIISLIMLMFTSSIAFISEVENKTLLRLKLSGLTSYEFLSGIGIVQLLIGILSVLLTLLTAMAFDFQYMGSIIVLILVAGLTAFSIIGFSLIIAAITKSANEVLVVGNFPMFLFMFFTGAAFPLQSDALFTIQGYPLNFQSLMTPTHAISALQKTLNMGMGISDIYGELISILVLSVFYFITGGIAFRWRHLRKSC